MKNPIVLTLFCLLFCYGCSDKSSANKAPDQKPAENDDSAYVQQGIKIALQGNLDSALDDFNKAIAINGKNAQYYLYRANAYSDKGEYKEAVIDYTKVLELNPENKKIYSLRGFAYLMQNKFKEALEDINHAILDNVDVRQNYNNRCYCYGQLGEYKKALVECNNAISLEPNIADTYDTRSGVYLHLKDYDHSWGDVMKVKELGGKSSPNILDELKQESGRT